MSVGRRPAARPKLRDVFVSVPDERDPSARRIRIERFLPVGEEPTGVEARVLTSVRTDRLVMMSFEDLHDMYVKEGT